MAGFPYFDENIVDDILGGLGVPDEGGGIGAKEGPICIVERSEGALVATGYPQYGFVINLWFHTESGTTNLLNLRKKQYIWGKFICNETVD